MGSAAEGVCGDHDDNGVVPAPATGTILDFFGRILTGEVAVEDKKPGEKRK